MKETVIRAEGEGADQIPSGMDNMIIQAMAETAQKAGKKIPGGSMYLINRIPFARGLGSNGGTCFRASSPTCWMGEPFDRKEILNITAEMEGHPDNAAPAI